MYFISPRAFLNKLDGFIEHEYEKEKQQWERIRWQTWVLMQPHVKSGTMNSPDKFIRFEWDKKDLRIELTDREKYILKKWEN